ncbi:hypothetical protein HMPREF0758_2469 [Serratia odorifera DSM 4582]|uniref:Uncharacterized protein n=1 Tax=Serratia odorifera DSM 4582 TaxID=667129 RepID=D4E2R9_SEROD|nr:hypothetical protein HMPREF0758_2469 [Serratia odorifera DSM 4582]
MSLGDACLPQAGKGFLVWLYQQYRGILRNKTPACNFIGML